MIATNGNDPRTLTWSDGTPNATGSNSVVVYVDSNSGHPGNGFSASPFQRTPLLEPWWYTRGAR